MVLFLHNLLCLVILKSLPIEWEGGKQNLRRDGDLTVIYYVTRKRLELLLSGFSKGPELMGYRKGIH